MRRIAIAVGLLFGSFLTAWAASNTLSGLSAGGAISTTDLFYDVQTTGVGGVKVTGTQFLSFVYGHVSGACTAGGSGLFTCNTNIGAGSNITTSGTASGNVTVNVVATPSFSSVIATGNLTAATAQVTGFLTASGVNLQTATIASINGGTSQCVHASTTGALSGTGSDCAAGGTAGGATTQVQFNNSSAFAGDPGFTYTTPAAVIITSGIITTTTRALSILQTWNSSGAAFGAPLFMNITNTASAAGSLVLDIEQGGGHIFTIDNGGGTNSAANVYVNNIAANITNGLNGAADWVINAPQASYFRLATHTGVFVDVDGTSGDPLALKVGNNVGIGYGAGASNAEVSLWRRSATNIDMIQANSLGTGVGLGIYNTIDVKSGLPTNFERGIADWTTTTNVFTIGTQAHGTGLGRNVVIIASNTIAQTISQTATTFAAALNAPAIAQLGATTTGYACWTTGTGAISEDSTACLASLRRLKKDIVPFTDATRELMALKPSQFQWKDPVDTNQRGQQLGFVAEDVHDVDSRLASYDGAGNLHGWRQDAMIAALVRGFQEQQVVIRQQQSEIEALKQRLH